ncbi:MAG TPA: FAD-dependent monooxygenase [Hyphomicrobiales bacterium]|nr:FAD-dependent monooxygenase [Hyphomicrobiales bacterium]
MRIAVLGGGPAGLYFAYLWRKRNPKAAVTLFEQNPAGATFGFGVVFSDRAMEFLDGDDPETAKLISARMESWRDIAIVHRGERIIIDGVGFSAIGRLELLRIFQTLAEKAGVDLRFGTAITSPSQLDHFDLIVAADGVNSIIRRGFEGDFGTSLSYLDEKFAWFGTTMPFETLTQTFIENEFGTFNAHHYRYAPMMSTFIVECDRATWLHAGLDRLDEESSRAICERIFADTLEGHRLIANKSLWRNFPWIWNRRWFHRNMVLVGDALHTAHYSIGSGTRLAMEDVLALLKALEAHPRELTDALYCYQAERLPIVEKLVEASRVSAAWYANFPEHMKLPPLELARSYFMRSGRMDEMRLAQTAPLFAQRLKHEEGLSRKCRLA